MIVPWCVYLFGPKWSINCYYYYGSYIHHIAIDILTGLHLGLVRLTVSASHEHCKQINEPFSFSRSLHISKCRKQSQNTWRYLCENYIYIYMYLTYKFNRKSKFARLTNPVPRISIYNHTYISHHILLCLIFHLKMKMFKHLSRSICETIPYVAFCLIVFPIQKL